MKIKYSCINSDDIRPTSETCKKGDCFITPGAYQKNNRDVIRKLTRPGRVEKNQFIWEQKRSWENYKIEWLTPKEVRQKILERYIVEEQ